MQGWVLGVTSTHDVSFNPDCLTFSLLELSLKKLALKFGKSWADLDDFKRIFWRLRSPVAGEGAHPEGPAHSGATLYLKVEGDKCQRKSGSPKKTQNWLICVHGQLHEPRSNEQRTF